MYHKWGRWSPGPTPYGVAVGSQKVLVEEESFFFENGHIDMFFHLPMGDSLIMYIWTLTRFSELSKKKLKHAEVLSLESLEHEIEQNTKIFVLFFSYKQGYN